MLQPSLFWIVVESEEPNGGTIRTLAPPEPGDRILLADGTALLCRPGRTTSGKTRGRGTMYATRAQRALSQPPFVEHSGRRVSCATGPMESRSPPYRQAVRELHLYCPECARWRFGVGRGPAVGGPPDSTVYMVAARALRVSACGWVSQPGWTSACTAAL